MRHWSLHIAYAMRVLARDTMYHSGHGAGRMPNSVAISKLTKRFGSLDLFKQIARLAQQGSSLPVFLSV